MKLLTYNINNSLFILVNNIIIKMIIFIKYI